MIDEGTRNAHAVIKDLTFHHDIHRSGWYPTCIQIHKIKGRSLSCPTLKTSHILCVRYYPGDEFHGYHHEEEIAVSDWPHIYLDDTGLRSRYDGRAFNALKSYENRPMVQVTWFGAKSYCEFTGGRLSPIPLPLYTRR